MSLTPDEVSSIVDPAPHSPPAGDWKDDDGQALDDYFRSMAQGPQVYQAVMAVVDALKPKPNNRMVTVRMNFEDIATATHPYTSRLVMPADPNRSSLTILSSSNGLNKDLFFSSESFNTMNDANAIPATQAAVMKTAVNSLVLPDYTGPLWAAPGALGGGVCIYFFVAITS